MITVAGLLGYNQEICALGGTFQTADGIPFLNDKKIKSKHTSKSKLT